jgi:2-oxoglutarate dehydrogenase E2 component (dihydrolipoamide succinyltransferase)
LGRGLEALLPSDEEPAPAPAAPAAPPPAAAGPADRTVDLDRLRVRIAENMVRSKQTAAHVWTVVEVDFERVEQVRRRHREAFKAREGFSLTYMPFISRAVIDALLAFPVVNSSFLLEEKQRIDHGQVQLGIAVDMDQGGLIVMKVPAADGMRMRQLAREIRRVAEKARAGKLEPDDITGTTFTITNPGPYGSLMSAPIINIPNVAILSTDTIVKRPVVVTDDAGNDAIAIRHIGYLGLTWDHRAFDGSTAVLFLRHIKDAIETWDWEHEIS